MLEVENGGVDSDVVGVANGGVDSGVLGVGPGGEWWS